MVRLVRRYIPEEMNGLTIKFRYDRFDAEYGLPGATLAQYDEILDSMKAGLSGTTKRSNAVSQTFLAAVRKWPDANPSDLWTFIINRAYCDRANHPAANARLNLEQSWKRTGGWALEQVLVSHYSPFLRERGITIRISSKDEKSRLLGAINDARIVPDKADILILYHAQDSENCLASSMSKPALPKGEPMMCQ